MTTVAELPNYQIYALRYATRPARRSEHFVGGDPHDADMPMDYFTWVVTGAGGRALVVDTGFTAAMASKRGRTYLRCPVQSLAALGVRADSVTDVVLTHLHYDHVGNFGQFPAARFHLQEQELQFATGRYMKYPVFAHGFELEEVIGMVRLNYAGRVELHSGVVELAPDSIHFFENMTTDRPFTVGFHLGQMVDAFRAVERLASSPDHIIPGHDPLIMRLYRPPSPELDGICVRLDVPPVAPAPASPHDTRRAG